MSLRFIDPVHLTAANVTLADCAERYLTVYVGCGPCRTTRGFRPEHVKGPASRAPMIELFESHRFKCEKCRAPSSHLHVEFEGNSVVQGRVILAVARS